MTCDFQEVLRDHCLSDRNQCQYWHPTVSVPGKGCVTLGHPVSHERFNFSVERDMAPTPVPLCSQDAIQAQSWCPRRSPCCLCSGLGRQSRQFPHGGQWVGLLHASAWSDSHL